MKPPRFGDGYRSSTRYVVYDCGHSKVITAEETENFPVNRELRDVELTSADMAFVNGAA